MVVLVGHVFNTSQDRQQNVPIHCVSRVIQTSGRRKVYVLDVLGGRFWGDGHVFNTRLKHMLGGHVFNTSQKRYQNVPIQGVSQVLQTSGGRSVDVMDVSDL